MKLQLTLRRLRRQVGVWRVGRPYPPPSWQAIPLLFVTLLPPFRLLAGPAVRTQNRSHDVVLLELHQQAHLRRDAGSL